MTPLPGQIVDLSSNNHGTASAFDFAAAKAGGVIGVIVKATEGTGYVNPFFDIDMKAAAAVGLPTAAYHFMGTGTAVGEASRFKLVAGAKAKVLDAETSTDSAWMTQFLNALDFGPAQRMTYGSASTLPRTLNSLLWPAAYGQAYPGFGDLWQWTDKWDCPGIGTVDASLWYGTQAQFNTFFGIATPTPIGDIVAVSKAVSAFGQDHVFAVDSAGDFLHDWIQNGAANGPEILNAHIPGTPKVVSMGNGGPMVNAAGQLVVTCEDVNGKRWYFAQAQGKSWGILSVG